MTCNTLLYNNSYALDKSDPVKAKIISIEKQPSTENEGRNKELIKVRILEGEYKNKVIIVDRELILYSSTSFILNQGDTVLVQTEQKNGKLTGFLINAWRVDYLKILTIIFLISLLIFGRLKGLLSLAGLVFSGVVIIEFLIPNILKGYNIMVLTIISVVLISVVSFILIGGFTKKSFIAICGTIGGTLISGILAYIYINIAKITGFENEETLFMVSSLGITIDYGWLYTCSILIGTVGVVMDVSMSITSSLFEIKSQSPNISFSGLFKSGLKVGKDIMSTMVNTLVLAYAGSSLPLLIIYFTTNSSFIYSINTESLAIEIIRSLCGSIGIISTIPLTCFLASSCLHNKVSNHSYKHVRKI